MFKMTADDRWDATYHNDRANDYFERNAADYLRRALMCVSYDYYRFHVAYVDSAKESWQQYCQYINTVAQDQARRDYYRDLKDLDNSDAVQADEDDDICTGCADYDPETDVSGEHLDIDDVVEYQNYCADGNQTPEQDAYFDELFEKARRRHHRECCLGQ